MTMLVSRFRIPCFAALFIALSLSMLESRADAIDAEARTISLAMSTEPPTLNSLVSTNVISSFVLGHVMEGLLQYDEQQQLQEAVAERWQLTETGAHFWLRADAKWSDGQPVTAHDFVFAWQQVVNPKTASPYAFIMFPIKHAERIQRGELTIDKLGVRAVNDRELVVDFERPCPYFLSLTAFMSYYPLREDWYLKTGQRYAADKEDMLYNGAFALAEWVHGAHLSLTKNPHYWQRDKVYLNRIDIPYITPDLSAQFNLFQDRQIALVSLDRETLSEAMAKGYSIKKFHTGAQYFLSLNFRQGHLTEHHLFRKALQAIFNPEILVNKVLGVPGNLPGESLFPITVKGIKGRFRDEYPAPRIARGLSLARSYLQQLKAQLQTERLPEVVLLAGDSPRAAREAEYLQYLLQQGLGLRVKIDAQMFKQYIEKMRRGEFDIAVAGWGPDFDDAITFGDLFSSWNQNNRGQYRSEEYDYWVRVAENSSDQQQRMAAMNELQNIIAEDVVIIPSFESGSLYVQQPALQGVVRRLFGPDPDFKFARIVSDEAQP